MAPPHPGLDSEALRKLHMDAVNAAHFLFSGVAGECDTVIADTKLS